MNDTHMTCILLEGHLVIKNAKEIKTALLSALLASQSLQLVLKNIVKIDLTFLQLLIAFQKSTDRLEKKLSFDIESTQYVKTIIQNCGLETILATSIKPHTNGLH